MKQFCRNSFLIVAGCLALASGVSVLAPTTLEAASIKENNKATSQLFQAVYADDLTLGAGQRRRRRRHRRARSLGHDAHRHRHRPQPLPNRPLPRLGSQRPARPGRASRIPRPRRPSRRPSRRRRRRLRRISRPALRSAAAGGGAGGKPTARAPGARLGRHPRFRSGTRFAAAGGRSHRPRAGRPASPTRSIRQCRLPARSCVRRASPSSAGADGPARRAPRRQRVRALRCPGRTDRSRRAASGADSCRPGVAGSSTGNAAAAICGRRPEPGQDARAPRPPPARSPPSARARALVEQSEGVEAGGTIQIGRQVDAPRPGMKGHGADQADQRPGDADLARRVPGGSAPARRRPAGPATRRSTARPRSRRHSRGDRRGSPAPGPPCRRRGRR